MLPTTNPQTSGIEAALNGGQDGLSAVLPPDFFNISPDDQDEDIETQEADPDFQQNLAEVLDESVLDAIATDLLGKIEDDITSSEPWMDRIAEVMEQIGITDSESMEEPFPGSSSAIWPMITKAMIQFQARALPELFPANPASAIVVGKDTPELLAQANRVEDCINYQITYQDRGNFDDFSKMLWWLPIAGSVLRKVYHDPIRNQNIARMVRVEDFIISFSTTSLHDSPRYTHRIIESHNTLLKLMQSGYYREIDIPETTAYNGMADNPVQELRNISDGKNQNASDYGSDYNHIQYESYTYYDIPGLEDMNEEGNPTGIALPYIITMNTDSKKVLSIYRNWKQHDPLKEKRICFAHYKYQEGPGFFGAGLAHLIGPLQIACTGALRGYGDALAFSILPCGWKSKDAKLSGTEYMQPGKFQDVDMVLDDINKAIKIAQFPPPPPSVTAYIEMLSAQAEEIVSTQNILMGANQPANMPVGTMLAMVEQSTKVISGQHKALHASFSEELRILGELNYDFLPDDDVFMMPGKEGVIKRSDFDCRVHIIPTADPTVASFQQRQAIDQALMQLMQLSNQVVQAAVQFPIQIFDVYKVIERLARNMKVPGLDMLMTSEDEFNKMVIQYTQQQAQQQAQQPNPVQIQTQLAQQSLQIEQAQVQIEGQKAQAAGVKAQSDMQKSQADIQLRQADLELRKQELELEKRAQDLTFVTNDKATDLRAGILSPQLVTATNNLSQGLVAQDATDQLREEVKNRQQDTIRSLAMAHAMQQNAQQRAMQQQSMIQNTAHAIPNQGPTVVNMPQATPPNMPSPPVPQGNQSAPSAPSNMPMPPSAQQLSPQARTGLLATLLNKIRGKS